MEKKQFIRILHRYVEGKATKEERELIETYYNLLLAKSKLESVNNEIGNKGSEKRLLNEIWNEIHEKERLKIRISGLTKVWRVAAALAVLFGIGAILYTLKIRQERERRAIAATALQNRGEEIKPGGNVAVLTLANGKKVLLDSASNGSLAQQGNISVIKLNNGQLAYKLTHSTGGNENQLVYNTLNTPRGGQYEIVLPDGTKVWLNSASSLHYPVAFSGKTRTVEMTGEGYFEIAPDAQKPFIVQVGEDEKIEVLGTRFNVNSYREEGEIKTTLQDGSIRVMGGAKSVILKPNEMAGFDKETGDMEIGKANVDAVIAWKNGLFYFDNTNIKEIMAQVSRWYNVKVVYGTKELDHKIYSGTLPRYSEVSALLKMLEMTGTVHFKTDGRTITVMN